MSKKTKKKDHEVEVEVHMLIIANDPNEQGNVQLFQMFYSGVFSNTIGVMRAKDKSTGNIESLLVGVEASEEGPKFYPLARVLAPDEVSNYLSPDGKGGYFGE